MSDILTPNFGESITSATVAAWHKNAGDPVVKGDILVTLETDKVSTDLEADESGVLENPRPGRGGSPIGAVLGRISPLDGSSAAPPSVPLETREKPASGSSLTCDRRPGTKAGKENILTGSDNLRKKWENRKGVLSALHQKTHESVAPYHRGTVGRGPAPGGHPDYLQRMRHVLRDGAPQTIQCSVPGTVRNQTRFHELLYQGRSQSIAGSAPGQRQNRRYGHRGKPVL